MRFSSASFGVLCLALLVPALLAYPPAETYLTDSGARLGMTIPSLGLDNASLQLVGPMRMRLGDPYDPGDGRLKINTEIDSMVLTGASAAGPVILRAHAPSPGCIQQKTAGVDFPANAWFDIRFELAFQMPDGPVTVFSDPDAPLRLTTMIDAVPPLDAEYAPEATFGGIGLVDGDGNRIGSLTFLGTVVGQQPTFSVAPGGPSGLAPADLFKRSTALGIRASALGLGPADDIDGLSYGFDFVFPGFVTPNYTAPSIIDLRFSVDEGAQGRAGSAVRREALKSEPTADEFQVGPVFVGFGGGSNLQVLDDNGDTAPGFPLQIADNVDALTELPPDFTDPDNDGRPSRDIYFSLAPGSPALGTNSAADILVSSNGGPPEVFISAEELGLDPATHDIDALCVNALLRSAVFSLAGSSDLTMFFQGTPFPWARVDNLGLDPGDDLNALKCHVGDATFTPGVVSASIEGEGETAEFLVELLTSIVFGFGSADNDEDFFGLVDTFDAESDDVTVSLDIEEVIPTLRDDDGGFILVIAFQITYKGWELYTGTLEMTADEFEEEFLLSGGPGPSQSVQSIQLFNADGSPSPYILRDLSITLDARPEPQLSADGFRDAAGFGDRPSPGGLASLFGEFPTERAIASAIPLPRRDGDTVEVLFETAGSSAAINKQGLKTQGATAMIPAPLLFVDPTQINVQVPWEVDPSGGTVTAIVRANGVDSDPVQLQVAPTSPGVFTTQFGAGPAIAINADGTLAQPTGAIGASRPAAVGDVIVLLVSGLGATTPPGVTGDDSFDLGGAFVRRDTVQPVRVTIGGVEAPVAFAGLSPQFVGVYQINVTVPEGVAPGDAVSLVVEVGGRSSRGDVTLAVSP